ncbi:hypothetical protein C4K35_1928 [Pseudomonas chlororaphis subsp. piscium]|nr:hypothetical protein C4K35_1928 [Pseudomonas chlororaphis subsp. piscium]
MTLQNRRRTSPTTEPQGTYELARGPKGASPATFKPVTFQGATYALKTAKVVHRATLLVSLHECPMDEVELYPDDPRRSIRIRWNPQETSV